MPEDDGDEIKVTYTVKEMFGDVQKDIAAGFQRVEAKLDTKAEKSDLDKISNLVERHSERIENVEAWQRGADVAKLALDAKTAADSGRRQRLWTYAVGAAGTIGTVGLVVAAFVVH